MQPKINFRATQILPFPKTNLNFPNSECFKNKLLLPSTLFLNHFPLTCNVLSAFRCFPVYTPNAFQFRRCSHFSSRTSWITSKRSSKRRGIQSSVGRAVYGSVILASPVRPTNFCFQRLVFKGIFGDFEIFMGFVWDNKIWCLDSRTIAWPGGRCHACAVVNHAPATLNSAKFYSCLWGNFELDKLDNKLMFDYGEFGS
jgi:hypothetical protein